MGRGWFDVEMGSDGWGVDMARWEVGTYGGQKKHEELFDAGKNWGKRGVLKSRHGDIMAGDSTWSKPKAYGFRSRRTPD